MKKIILVAAVTLVLFMGMSLLILNAWGVHCRTVKLVISGPEGQRFTGSYAADGVTNILTAVTPTTVTFPARNTSFEFRRDGGTGEFRVALSVDGLMRTSTCSGNRSGVRGQIKYSPGDERYWAAGF